MRAPFDATTHNARLLLPATLALNRQLGPLLAGRRRNWAEMHQCRDCQPETVRFRLYWQHNKPGGWESSGWVRNRRHQEGLLRNRQCAAIRNSAGAGNHFRVSAIGTPRFPRVQGGDPGCRRGYQPGGVGGEAARGETWAIRLLRNLGISH